ncbi:MAG: type I restriction enzyme endonuclease domain-containing protein [Synechococcaceae cyanobacterium]
MVVGWAPRWTGQTGRTTFLTLGGQNLTIDWQYKENGRARLRTMIKALLKRYKYPPDQEASAVELVLRQTEVISEEWAREDLGNQIQAAVAGALEKQFSA